MTSTEGNEKSHHIIIPPNIDLKEKASRLGDGKQAYRQALKRADQAIEQLSCHFSDWMKEEINALAAHFQQVQIDGMKSPAGEKLYSTAHDMKGQSSTLGFPIIADICYNLCALIENTPEITHIDMRLIEHHIHAVRTIYQEGPNRQKNNKAEKLVELLRITSIKVTQQQLETVKQNQPSEQLS